MLHRRDLVIGKCFVGCGCSNPKVPSLLRVLEPTPSQTTTSIRAVFMFKMNSTQHPAFLIPLSNMGVPTKEAAHNFSNRTICFQSPGATACPSIVVELLVNNLTIHPTNSRAKPNTYSEYYLSIGFRLRACSGGTEHSGLHSPAVLWIFACWLLILHDSTTLSKGFQKNQQVNETRG